MDLLLLKIQDKKKIDGESKIDGHDKEIKLLSFSHGVAMQITGDAANTKRTSGKPNHQDFTVTKYMDGASCGLYDACNTGQDLGKVQIWVGRNDNDKMIPLMEYELQNALISSVSVGGGGGGEPQETVTFNYTAIKWQYHVQGEAGGDEGQKPATWDLAANKHLAS